MGDLRAQARHDVARSPAGWRDFFDAADPRGASALYALSCWEEAAGEVAEMILRHCGAGLLLDLGCGAGRVAQALAGRVEGIIAVDISAAMLRHWQAEGCLRVQASGAHLGFLADGSFATIAAVDSFPYLANSGLDEIHLAEARRLLFPGGHLFIANYAYDGKKPPPVQGLSPIIWGGRPFRHWDGELFVFRKDAS